jgi:hypothetical protein
MTAATKEIGYSYPTSPGAVARGFGRSGCWHLDVLDAAGGVVRSVGAYATEAEVREQAARIDLPHSRWSMRPPPAVVPGVTGATVDTP